MEIVRFFGQTLTEVHEPNETAISFGFLMPQIERVIPVLLIVQRKGSLRHGYLHPSFRDGKPRRIQNDYFAWDTSPGKKHDTYPCAWIERIVLIDRSHAPRPSLYTSPAKPEKPSSARMPSQAMDGNQSAVQKLDSCDLTSPCHRLWIKGHRSRPQFAILGRWIPASLTGMTGFNHLCITTSAPRGNACLGAPAPRNPPPERGNHQKMLQIHHSVIDIGRDWATYLHRKT